MPTLPFHTLQRLDLPLTEMICSRLDFVHDAFLQFPFEVSEKLPEGGGDLVVLTGKQDWAERVRELGEHRGRAVLVFAQGDGSIAETAGSGALPRNLVALYATNNELVDRRAISVPIGVRINNLQALRFVRQNRRPSREGLLYGNFALNGSHYLPEGPGTPHARARLAEQLRDEPWATLDLSRRHRESREDLIRFYSQTAAHRFVLSPEGKGIDCYRTWESIYLGAIPIVRASPAMSAFSGLPILFTEDYGELSEAYLEQRWEELSQRSFDIGPMLSSYYRRRFLASVAALRDPLFVCWKADPSLSAGFVAALRRSSLLAGSIVAETPVPPFVTGSDLMTPDVWHAPGGLRLRRNGHGLEFAAERTERGAAEVRLNTIAGAPFRLTARVRGLRSTAPRLTVKIGERREVIAAAEVGGEEEETLRLDFVARSDHTVLSVQTPAAESPGLWLVNDLSIGAAV